ncbi:MAG: exo-alpha-sialidase, partial [Frankiales bacterium]|nr:exo-alpha-sialidase [Frankiales bacterium]
MTVRPLAGSALAVALVVAALPAAAGSHPAASNGCGSSVVVHHAGGKVLRSQPAHLPRACGHTTGLPGAESHIVVRNDGSVVYTPAVLPHGLLGTGTAPVDENGQSQSNASPAGLAFTRDGGAHWRVVKPSGITWNPTDHSDYVDPASGRMFFEDYGPIPLAPSAGAQQEGPAHINFSDDMRHWHHVVISGLSLPENPRFTSGRTPKHGDKPHGYPDVVYFCANTNVGFVSPVIAGRVCFRSLDGGTTWDRRAMLFTGAAPQHPECGGQGEVYSAIDGYYPSAAPDGSLYVMVACGGKTYLARSTDEAATFPILHGQSAPVTLPVPTPSTGDVGGTPELRILSDGTFLLSYQQGAHLLLRLSHTHGITWTKPLDLTAPGVTA